MLNKRELARIISRETYGLTYKEAYAVVDYAFELMCQSLLQGNMIRIDGFGTFVPKQQKGYTTRHPKSGDTVKVPERTQIRFRTGAALKRRFEEDAHT